MRGFRSQIAALLAGVAVGLFSIPATGLSTVLYQETFGGPVANWSGPAGGGAPWGSMVVTNGHAVFRLTRNQATDPNALDGWVADWTLPLTPTLQRGRTLVLSTDLLGGNQNDAFTVMGVDLAGSSFGGYGLLKDQDEITLWKISSGLTCLFWETKAIQNVNATMILSSNCHFETW